jgi:DNA repair exonuclease SbcCD ATPase subunit
MSPEDIKQALENIEFNAEDMLEKLERTANLLKELQREQAMEEIVRKSQDLMQSQKELADETSDAEAGDREKMNELAAREGDLARKSDELQKSLEELARELSGSEPEASQELQSASDQMTASRGPQKNMRAAADLLNMGQKQQAMEKLISLFRLSLQAQQTMSANSGRRIAVNLQKHAGRTLELSFRQETLANRLRGAREREAPGDNQEIAQTQNSYLRATQGIADEIVKLSGMTLAVSPKLMEALGFAIERMQNSLLFLEQNKPFMSAQHAGDAVESLNEVVIEMLRSAEMCSQPGGGGQSLAERIMQQLIPGQQDIVRQTRAILELQAAAENLRQERLEQARRLAAEQRSLKELAENIQRDLRENRELLGRLDRTIEEMEAVSKDLDQGNVSRDLIEREQRILSRLLDAQRSIHTRDYENERESITAGDVFSKNPPPGQEGPDSQSLREALRRAMQLKAPGEFEDLIKLYFRALAEEAAPGSGAEGGKP